MGLFLCLIRSVLASSQLSLVLGFLVIVFLPLSLLYSSGGKFRGRLWKVEKKAERNVKEFICLRMTG